jgi:predicted nucleic acid-binding protein
MASKVFLDANILLDYILQRDNYTTSKQIIEWIIDRKIQAFITPAIVHIVGYYLTKFYGGAKAKELLLTLLIDVTVIDLTHDGTMEALHSRINDIEDALQYYAALHHKLDYFISRDKALQKSAIPALPVYSAEQFIREYGRELPG